MICPDNKTPYLAVLLFLTASLGWTAVMAAAPSSISRMPDGAAIIRDATPREVADLLVAGPDDDRTAARDEARQAGPDERILWDLFHNKKYNQVRVVIEQWRQSYPEWLPPKDMLRSLAEQQRMQQERHKAAVQRQRQQLLQDGFFSERPERFLPLSLENGELFTCRQLPNLWALLPLYRFSHSQDELLTLVQNALQTADCADDGDRFLILQNAQNYLDVDHYDALLAASAPPLRDPGNLAELRNIRYRKQALDLMHAIDDNAAAPAVMQRLDDLAPEISVRQDGPVALAVAWFLLEHDQPAAANGWFDKVYHWAPGPSPAANEAEYGRILALHRQGRNDDALALARDRRQADPKIDALYTEILAARFYDLYNGGQHDEALILAQKDLQTVPEARNLAGEILLTRAWEHYDRQQYEQSRTQVEQALSYLESPAKAKKLLAWLDYREGHFQQALAQFENLFQQQPDSSLVQGIVYSRIALGAGHDELAELAASNPTDFGLEVATVLNRDLYFHKEFLAAAQQGGEENQRLLLQNIDAPAVEAAILYRSKTGDAGTSALKILHLPTLKFTYRYHTVHTFSLTAHRLQLQSGRFASWGTPVGSAGILQGGDRSLADPPDINLDNGLAWCFDYQKSGWWHPFFAIGSTPANGVIEPGLTFRAGLKKHIPSGTWQMEFFSRPVRESVLSYTGMHDPYSTREWGRVLKTGISGSLFSHLAPRWGLYSEAHGGVLRGKNVDDNRMVHLAANLGYDLQPAGFDYFTIGPGLRYEHYSKNRGHFTLGHGGYFSPDTYYNGGLSLDFLTVEGRKHIVKGHAGIGYQALDYAAAELFPGQPDLANRSLQLADGTSISEYPADSSHGVSYDFELLATWLFAPQWQLSGGFGYNKTYGYEEYNLGVNLRYFLAPRRASFSTDLPPEMFGALH
jgi:hypothetical protein